MTTDKMIYQYRWRGKDPHTSAYLLRPIQHLLQDFSPRQNIDASRALDLGCGNGALAEQLDRWGYSVTGIDPSTSGVLEAKRRCPNSNFYQASADPDEINLLGLGLFDLVISTEVVEHCYAPRTWSSAAFAALRPGGLLITSTPYHGYIKNLALAVSGKLDAHFTALWDGGHIKFWSRKTLSRLLTETGFEVVAFRGAGRCPWLWKSMLIAAYKPLA